VVEAVAGSCRHETAVERGGEGVGEIASRCEIANVPRVLVLSAVAHGVDEIPALSIDAHEFDARGLIGAEPPRIHDHLIRGGRIDRQPRRRGALRRRGRHRGVGRWRPADRHTAQGEMLVSRHRGAPIRRSMRRRQSLLEGEAAVVARQRDGGTPPAR
jgi:hypothetical protein